jgi:hypothetical protein
MNQPFPEQACCKSELNQVPYCGVEKKKPSASRPL